MSYTFDEPVPQSQLADFGSRLGAILIDIVILSAVIFIFFGILVGLIFVASEEGMEEPGTGFMITTVLLYFFGPSVLVISYQALWESSRKQGTPGKILVGLQVVTSEGKRLSFWNAVGRNASRFLSGILMIGYLMALFTDRKQTLHDVIADTLVINKPAGFIEQEENIYRKNLEL